MGLFWIIKRELRNLGMACLGMAAMVVAGSPVAASDAEADTAQKEGAIFERQFIMEQLDKDGLVVAAMPCE